MATPGGERRRRRSRSRRRSASRSSRAGELVEHGSVEPRHDERRLDLPERAKELDLDLARRRATPLEPTARRTRPSARASELSTPAPRRSGSRDEARSDAGQPERTHSSLRGVERISTAAVARARGRAAGTRPLEAREQRGARTARTRAPPRPGSRGSRSRGVEPVRPRTTGWPGPDRDTLHDDLPDAARITATAWSSGALRRAGDEQDEIGLRGGPCECRGEKLGVVRRRSAARTATPPASSTIAASMSEFVSTISPGPGSVPSGTSSSPEGRIATSGRRRTRDRRLPDGRERRPGRQGGGAGRPRNRRSPAATSSPTWRTFA